MYLPPTVRLFRKPQSSQCANMLFVWLSLLAPLSPVIISILTCSYYRSSNVSFIHSFWSVCYTNSKGSMSYHKSIQLSSTGRMPLEVGQVHCIHSGQIFAWYTHRPNIKKKNAMKRKGCYLLLLQLPLFSSRGQNMNWKSDMQSSNSNCTFLPETPVEGLLHSKRHRSTAEKALCDNLVGFEMGRCPTKRSWCFQVQWTAEGQRTEKINESIRKKTRKLWWEQHTCPSIPSRMIMIKKHTDQSWGHGRRVTACG